MFRVSTSVFCTIILFGHVGIALGQLAGDLTGDCAVTADDIAPFVSVLIGNETGSMLVSASDVDDNGLANARDIAGFVSQLITAAECESCITLASGFSGGDGTPANPYRICNAAQLQLAHSFLNADFVLTSDIDLAGVAFTPIGQTTFGDSVIHYDGTFHGAHHRVRNLSIQLPTTDVIGLFGKLGPNAVVEDLGVENVNLRGQLCVGGFAAENDGIVRRCYVTGNVVGATYIGGMVGDNRAIMEDCYADVSVTGTSSVGGFAGVTFLSPTYTRCYSVGSVSGSSSQGGFIGGVIGPHVVTNCYWDTQSSGAATSNGGTGLTTAQMMQQASFVGWDFIATWTMPGGDYPRLAWE